MERATIQGIAEEFWAEVGEPEAFPRSLESAVLWALPLGIFKLPRLWVSDAQSWLARRGIRFHLKTGDRPLHGCLLAYRGRGCVLLNGADSLAESRFSLSHEVAHFLLDYHRPRQRAVKRLGPSILEVFDGIRPPTVQERVHAILSGVPIGFHTHLMGRSENGVIGCDLAGEAEDAADRLALELLAPQGEVRRRVSHRRLIRDQQSLTQIATMILQKDFGLPPGVAAGYAQYLYPPVRRSSVREWLRQQETEGAP